jgi:cyclic-di-GMP phosphodiesterase TipF (flagellum assembly factor)
MTRQFAEPEPFYARFSDAFVIFSVTVLSLAAGAWFITQMGLELTPALLGALGVYCTLLLLHLLVRRSYLQTSAGSLQHAYWEDNAAAQRFEAELAQRLEEAANAPAQEEMLNAESGEWPEPLPMPAHAPPSPPSAADTQQDLFNFRPSRSPYFESDEPQQAAPRNTLGRAQPEQTESGEVNVELIQNLIKKLADELNEGDSRAPVQTSAAPEAMVGRSAAALGTAARAMRGEQQPAAGQRGPAQPNNPDWWPTARSNAPRIQSQPVDPQVARIAEAIAAERLEVLIEPIHALNEGRSRHYEISMRLLTSDGFALEQSDYSRTALGSGLMPRIDAARMLRAARVARRLSQRGTQGSVLTAITGEALTGDAFLDAAAAQPGTDGRVNLVLSFTQADVRNFTPVHAEALGGMAAGGFAFALENVTDLDMDFGGLKAMGFEFIKLDAEVFLEGLRTSNGRIPASDICRHLAEFGLTLIVGRIDDDWLQARILGFGVLYGKGALFGGPKVVKPEVVAEPAAA